MTAYILLILTLIYAAFSSFFIKSISLKIASRVAVISVILIFTSITEFMNAGYILYGIALVVLLLYSWISTMYKAKDIWVVSIILIPLLAYYIFLKGHLPGLKYIRYMLIVSLIGFVVLLIKYKNLKSFSGALSIYTVDALVNLFEF